MGASVIVAAVIAQLMHIKVARVPVVIVCVLFGLAPGSTPIGDGVNAGLAVLGEALATKIGEL